MKVLVTARGESVSDDLDPRFGRARYFILVDTETGKATAHDNAQNLNAAQGAGIQAAENVARTGARVVLTGHVGPKAFATLQSGGVGVYTGASGTVAEAVEQFKAGALMRQDGADVEGHWV